MDKIIIPEDSYYMVLTAEIDARGSEGEKSLEEMKESRAKLINMMEGYSEELLRIDFIRYINMFTWLNFCIAGLEAKLHSQNKPKKKGKKAE